MANVSTQLAGTPTGPGPARREGGAAGFMVPGRDAPRSGVSSALLRSGALQAFGAPGVRSPGFPASWRARLAGGGRRCVRSLGARTPAPAPKPLGAPRSPGGAAPGAAPSRVCGSAERRPLSGAERSCKPRAWHTWARRHLGDPPAKALGNEHPHPTPPGRLHPAHLCLKPPPPKGPADGACFAHREEKPRNSWHSCCQARKLAHWHRRVQAAPHGLREASANFGDDVGVS